MLSTLRLVQLRSLSTRFYSTNTLKYASFVHGSPLRLKIIVPPLKTEDINDFSTPGALALYVNAFHGVLRQLPSSSAPEEIPKFLDQDELKHVNPSEKYEIVSPFWRAMDERQTHSQIADKAFESKSRVALMSYLYDQNIVFEELGREMKRDGVTICEWEGVFRLMSGEVIFLECKHRMTMKVVNAQSDRLSKAMAEVADSTQGVVFLSGEFWDEGVQEFCMKSGFGVMFENGTDLSVSWGNRFC